MLSLRNIIAVNIAKLVSYFISKFKLGAAGTWPGEIALKIDSSLTSVLANQLEMTILIAGTNGKTTTAKMVEKIVSDSGVKVILNTSGANLVNGITSTLIKNSNLLGRLNCKIGIFEVDENSLPAIISKSKKKLIIVLLNLFRDQLDRYGEVDVIAEKWSKALKILPKETKIILNADDPQIAYLGKNVKFKVIYFGLNNSKLFLKTQEHATDSIFCLSCLGRLSYDGIYYSHLGIWKCTKCGYSRPKVDSSGWKSKLLGVYNLYNTSAAAVTAKSIGISDVQIQKALSDFSPAFGRQEEIVVSGKRVRIFLAKNPASFNESLRTAISLGVKEILLVLNDRIPDGKDISWIWDVDFEMLPVYLMPVVSGDRVHDLALRIKYARPVLRLPKGAVSQPQTPILVYDNLETALLFCLGSPNRNETLYILATYSAMLEVRKILKGRKIL